MDNSRHEEIDPFRFLWDLNKAATHALSNGAPFFVYHHFAFIAAYIKAWQERRGGASVDFDLLPSEQGITGLLMAVLLQARRVPTVIKPWIMYGPLIVSVIQGNYAVIQSSLLGLVVKSARSIPPLITALIVVFLTGDAWQILGAGFTLRFFLLVTVFLLASLLFLIRKDYWVDLHPSELEMDTFIKGPGSWASIRDLIKLGATPLPMVKPIGIGGRAIIFGTYLTYAALSLIAVALSVSLGLILAGTILVSADGTQELAKSVNVIWTLPGNFVITKQLLSLSFSLGAFAAFFLVAGQRADDRQAFMRQVLSNLREALLLYSVYCRAHDHVAAWTGIAVTSPPLVREVIDV
jgi:hypothetical protein